jgi:hypothetical protein
MAELPPFPTTPEETSHDHLFEKFYVKSNWHRKDSYGNWKRFSNSDVMSNRFILCLILIIASMVIITSCGSPPPAITSSPPPPVTDCDSFIENLRHAGVTVVIKESEKGSIPFASYYLDKYSDLIRWIIRQPGMEFSQEESKEHKEQINEQIHNMELTTTLLSINGEDCEVIEYNYIETADLDAGYINLKPNIQTNDGIISSETTMTDTFMHYFKKDRIIVMVVWGPFNRTQEDLDNIHALLNLLRQLLGEEFHTTG